MSKEAGLGNVRGFQLLSARETQLILLAGDGLTDKEIARELEISCGTVITLWSRVRAKLRITSRVAAVAVMSSVVARLNFRLPLFAEESIGVEGLMGRLSGVRVLVNSKLVVLSCSAKAASLFGIRPGLSLDGPHVRGIRVHSLGGRNISEHRMPWATALVSGQPVAIFEMSIIRGTIEQRFCVECEIIEDPVLNRVAAINLRPIAESWRGEAATEACTVVLA